MNEEHGLGLADGAAGDRDPGRRRLGLYPDQRDLDHRRPDLPRDRPLLSRHPSGHQRRPLGQPRRLGGADQGDEAGRRPHQARARAVPRDGGLRPVRLRPRSRDPAPAGARRAPDRAPEAAAVLSRCRSRSRWSRSSPARAAISTRSRWRQIGRFEAVAAGRDLKAKHAGDPRGDPRASARSQAPPRSSSRPSSTISPRPSSEDATSAPMATLKDLRVRIRSVKSTQKITSAMKMVAAVEPAPRPGAGRGGAALCRAHGAHAGLARRQHRRAAATRRRCSPAPARTTTHLLVVATSDRGLSGGFNATIVREARRTIRELERAGKKVKILTIGRKGRDRSAATTAGSSSDSYRGCRPAAARSSPTPMPSRQRVRAAVRGRRVRRLPPSSTTASSRR